MSSADDVDEAPPPDASRRRLPRRRLALGVLLTVTVLLTAFVVERHRSSTASATPVEGSNYLVRTGDTITSVADLHAVDRDDLMDAHDLTLENSLAPGERLVVPDPPRGEPPAELTADTNKLRYAAAFEAAEARHDLPPGLLKALAWQESEWVNATVGEDGEQGLGQLHPEVTDFLHREVVDRRLDPTVAEDNIELTAAYLAFLLEFAEGDRAAALAGYWADSNAPGGGNWDLATAAFIRRVLASAPDFAASLAPAPTTTSTAP